MSALRLCRFVSCALVAVLCLYPLMASAKVVISEVMWMGSDQSTSDEWVELACIDESTDLSGFRLTSLNTSANEVTVAQIATGSIMNPGDIRIISKQTAANSRLLLDPWIVSSAMTLPNTKLLLRLRDRFGNIVDQADDGAGEPLAGDNPSGGIKASMERVSLSGCGTLASTWRTAADFSGFDEGALVKGTPGSFPTIYSSSSSSNSSQSSSSLIPEEPSGNCIKDDHIIVSEVMPNPAGSDTGNEWLELFNPGSSSVTLHGWTVEMQGSSKHAITELTLAPGEYRVIPSSSMGLQMTNAGGVLILRDNTTATCQTLSYPTLEDGMAFGQDPADLQWKPLCFQTPAAANVQSSWEPEIIIESGATMGTGKTKINTALSASEDMNGQVQCSVDFGDSQKATTCNPAWHTYSAVGSYLLSIKAVNACGTTVERSLGISVYDKTQSTSAVSAVTTSQVFQSVIATGDLHMLLITSVLPNPTGDDKGHEWVEVTNIGTETVSVSGLRFSSGKKVSKPLETEVFQPREKKKYIVSLLGLSLGNETGMVELQDPQGAKLSALSWNKAREGIVYHYSPGKSRIPALVTRTIDGDTFEALLTAGVERSETVRLIGVDTPETVDPKKPVQFYGKEASDYTRALLLNKNVELEFDTNERDVYGRLLAYVYLPDGNLLQELLLKNGYAKSEEQYLYSMKEDFKKLGDEAKLNGAGMWGVSKKDQKKILLASTVVSSNVEVSNKSSSSKKSTTKEVALTQKVSTLGESKISYVNVYDESLVESSESSETGSGEDLYASLLQDQAQITIPPEQVPSRGISSGVLVAILFVNSVIMAAAVGAALFFGLRMRSIKA